MDNIHEIDKKPWISKNRINLRNLVEERRIQLLQNNVFLEESTDKSGGENEEKNIKEKELSDAIENFVKSNEKDVKPFFLFNSADEKTLVHNPDCELRTYKLQTEHAKRMISDRAYKFRYLMKLRTTRRELLMRHLAQINRPTLDTESTSNPAQVMASQRPDISAIIVVQIWPQPCKTTKIRLEKEILFRTDQCLTELRDQFKCQRDYGVPMDLSDEPEQAERIFRGELFKSGFFLIDDTFYNDMRDPNNTDLSTNIVEWASKDIVILGVEGNNVRVSRGLGPFNRAKLENHKFEDLNFKLGCPYLYLHQGDCEHLFTISDIRYVPNDLEFQKTRFPFVTATSISRKADNLRCYMCKSRPPHWYTRNNNRLPVDPFFFCESCFYSFNYDKDKKKIGEFQAYLYTGAFGIPDNLGLS